MALGLEGWVANTADGVGPLRRRGPAGRPRDACSSGSRKVRSSAIVDRVSAAWMPATGTLGPFEVRSGGHPRRLTRADPSAAAGPDRWAIPFARCASAILTHDGAELCRRGTACAVSRRPRPGRPSSRRAAGAPLANDVRADAIRIYSRAWDERARRELEALLRRNAAERATAPAVGRARRPAAGPSAPPDAAGRRSPSAGVG